MALVCRETDKEFLKGKRDCVVMHPIVPVGFAVDSSFVEAIQSGRETYADPCRRYSEGFNVHQVEGSIGRISQEGHFQVSIPGPFLFSIMRKTALNHFPRTIEVIDQLAERRTSEN